MSPLQLPFSNTDGVHVLTDPFFGANEGTEYDTTPV